MRFSFGLHRVAARLYSGRAHTKHMSLARLVRGNWKRDAVATARVYSQSTSDFGGIKMCVLGFFCSHSCWSLDWLATYSPNIKKIPCIRHKSEKRGFLY